MTRLALFYRFIIPDFIHFFMNYRFNHTSSSAYMSMMMDMGMMMCMRGAGGIGMR